MFSFSNEIILVFSLFLTYGGVLACFRLLGREGLFAWSVSATIFANIEVLVLVRAFGMEMTLGNVLFASTFLVTDIASEHYGKRDAEKIVNSGIFASLFFITASFLWFLYSPSENDKSLPLVKSLFSSTPRVVFSGFAVYAIVQVLDVFIYHKIWSATEKKSGSRSSFLWLRNNLSTFVSQIVNAFLFNFAAFYGTYDTGTLLRISFSTLAVYAVTTVADTPFVYLSRKISRAGR